MQTRTNDYFITGTDTEIGGLSRPRRCYVRKRRKIFDAGHETYRLRRG